jgi:hypothetical protein
MANGTQQPPSGASLSDLLTAVKNLVTAVNTLQQSYVQVNGQSSLEAISAPTVVKSSAGRVAAISVTTAGSSTGMVYDSNQVAVKTAPLYVIPEAVGLYVVNLATNSGILVIPGSGQVLAISWS